jgi:hypothetical protein
LRILATKNAATVDVSCLVTKRIAKVKKSHRIGEILILPYVKDIASIMIGSDRLIKLQPLSLSNTTIMRRIQDMACAISSYVVDVIK